MPKTEGRVELSEVGYTSRHYPGDGKNTGIQMTLRVQKVSQSTPGDFTLPIKYLEYMTISLELKPSFQKGPRR